MKWLNYHHLIYFKVIAREGSISKASQILRVGQPALSSQLKSFEEYLGVKLFERKSRSLILTDAGKVTLEYAERVHKTGQELIQVMEDKLFSKQIHLSVGALDGVPKNLICDIVDYAHKKTKCLLSIYEGTMNDLVAQLLTHKIEIIISDHEVQGMDYSGVRSKKFMSSPIQAFASSKFGHLKNDFPLSLKNTPCVLPTSHSKLRRDIEHYFEHHGIKPNIIAETQDTSVQKLLSTKGDGVIFLPSFAAKELIKSKSLIKIGQLQNLKAEYFLIHNKRLIENPALELILNQDFSKIIKG
ncbi:MAG: LysR family transcriptional regulator [Bdellovibrio sp.]